MVKTNKQNYKINYKRTHPRKTHTQIHTQSSKQKSKQIRKQTHKNHKQYFIISECYNQKYNKLLTNTLKVYLKEYNLMEYVDIYNNDIKLLKQRGINIFKDENCYNLLKLTRQTKLPYTVYFTNQLENIYEFIWLNPIENIIDKRFNNVKSNLRNIINDDKTKCIDNKSILYKNMMLECNRLAKKHLALTFLINDYKQYDFNGIYYILRPIDSFAGKDIFYISSKKELDNAITYYNKTKNYRSVIYGNNVIASEYIINPLLFNGYKFHLRMYYLISYIDNIFNSFFLEEGDILTAEKPYTITQPFTKETHDTHQTSSEDDLVFPKDINGNGNGNGNGNIDTDDLIKQMRDIMKCASRILKNDKYSSNIKWLYPEQNNGFLIMGADFMINTNGNVILLEINGKPGFGYNNRKNDITFSKYLFDWINKTILEPTYKYKDQYYARKHKTYLDI